MTEGGITGMELAVRPEPTPDYRQTAGMAEQAFGGGVRFDPARLEWLYDRGFSEGTLVLGLYASDMKVGQVALVRQRVRVGATEATAVNLMDLFILQKHRSREAIALLYGQVAPLCAEAGVRFILAVPNGKAAGVNARFLGLQSFLRLDIRAGVARPWSGSTTRSARIGALGQSQAEQLFSQFLPDRANGLAWTATTLWARLQDPSAVFAVHATDNLLLVSSRRVMRRIPHTLLCAFIARPGAVVRAADVRAVTTAACRLHRRPLFVYVGLNRSVPLPGWRLPERLRPSPMVVQMRDFSEGPPLTGLDRFESLDFDFA